MPKCPGTSLLGIILETNSKRYMGRHHIDRLAQERRNSSALAMELRLSCTNPSTWKCFPQYCFKTCCAAAKATEIDRRSLRPFKDSGFHTMCFVCRSILLMSMAWRISILISDTINYHAPMKYMPLILSRCLEWTPDNGMLLRLETWATLSVSLFSFSIKCVGIFAFDVLVLN